MADKTVNFIKEFLSNDYTTLKTNLESLIKEYERKSNRLDKIIKQSDKQQNALIKSNATITQQKDELNKLHTYNVEQQNIAKEKLEAILFNSLPNDKLKSSIIYKPSDILSGDFYSIYTLNDGTLLAYILDGQGHGISPALTIFSISSTIMSLISTSENFEDLVDKLFPMISKFLGEIEQLSYIMINIDQDKIKYLSGGTYPFLIKLEDNIKTIKSNNLPFMNFSDTPKIDILSPQEWDSILLYTDGLVEDLDDKLQQYTPKNILQDNSKFLQAKELINLNSYEDDITVLKIYK